ncbi:hypothetical protein BHE86_18335 [Shigella sp. FC1655]|nr:hypothetical protein BHE86_18335 [Shigella sp. FC1655]
MKVITNNPEFYEVLRKYSESEVKGNSYIMQKVSESKIPSGAGNLSSRAISELGGLYIQEKLRRRKKSEKNFSYYNINDYVYICFICKCNDFLFFSGGVFFIFIQTFQCHLKLMK